MMFLLGRQAMLGHDPPTYLRSITATRCPCPAKAHAATVDPVPPPRITKSYSSTFSFCPEGVFRVVLMAYSFGNRYTAFISPPSMRTDVPVIHLAIGETMKPSRSAISSGRPYRPIPTCSGNLFVASSTVML